MSVTGYTGPAFSSEELSAFEGRGSDAFLAYVRRGPTVVKKWNPGWTNITIANARRTEAKKFRLELEELESSVNSDTHRSPQDYAC